MAKITYENKVALNPQPSVANKNKVSDADMNEIKTSVNDLYDEVDTNATYSSTEQRIGTWIDGKPLYRKTILFPEGNGGNSNVVAYTLSNYGITNVDTIFIVHPSYYSNKNSLATYPFQYNDGTAFECNVNKTTLNVKLGYNLISTAPFVITLNYTKTTD